MVKVQIHIGDIPLVQKEYSPEQQVINAISVVEFSRSIPSATRSLSENTEVLPIPETNNAKVVRLDNDFTVVVMSNNPDFVSAVWYGCEKYGVGVSILLGSSEVDLDGAFGFFNLAFNQINKYCTIESEER